MENGRLGSELLVNLLGFAPEQLQRDLGAAPLRFANGGSSALPHVGGADGQSAFAARDSDNLTTTTAAAAAMNNNEDYYT